MTQILGGVVSSSADSRDDILNFCSGKFEGEGFPDTLQMLLDEGKSENRYVQIN